MHLENSLCLYINLLATCLIRISIVIDIAKQKLILLAALVNQNKEKQFAAEQLVKFWLFWSNLSLGAEVLIYLYLKSENVSNLTKSNFFLNLMLT